MPPWPSGLRNRLPGSSSKSFPDLASTAGIVPWQKTMTSSAGKPNRACLSSAATVSSCVAGLVMMYSGIETSYRFRAAKSFSNRIWNSGASEIGPIGNSPFGWSKPRRVPCPPATRTAPIFPGAGPVRRGRGRFVWLAPVCSLRRIAGGGAARWRGRRDHLRRSESWRWPVRTSRQFGRNQSRRSAGRAAARCAALKSSQNRSKCSCFAERNCCSRLSLFIEDTLSGAMRLVEAMRSSVRCGLAITINVPGQV